MSRTTSGKKDFTTLEAYVNFMCNSDNMFKCDRCPENIGHDGNGFDHLYPCGQQRCWVDCYADYDGGW